MEWYKDKIYYLMCEKAKEIQKLRGVGLWVNGDFYTDEILKKPSTPVDFCFLKMLQMNLVKCIVLFGSFVKISYKGWLIVIFLFVRISMDFMLL